MRNVNSVEMGNHLLSTFRFFLAGPAGGSFKRWVLEGVFGVLI